MTFGQSLGFEGDEFCHSDGERVVFWICDKIYGYTGLFCEKNVVSGSILGLLELLNHIFRTKRHADGFRMI